MSEMKNTYVNNPGEHWQSRSNQRALKAHLNWKLCWQTRWAPKGAGETIEPLNWWCYSRWGPVFPGSCILRCSQGLVSLRGVSLFIPRAATKLWHVSVTSPWPRNLRNSMDSKSNSPVNDLSSAEVTLSQSPSGKGRGIKEGRRGAEFLRLWSKSELIIRKSAPPKHKKPQALSVLFVEVIQKPTQRSMHFHYLHIWQQAGHLICLFLGKIVHFNWVLCCKWLHSHLGCMNKTKQRKLLCFLRRNLSSAISPKKNENWNVNKRCCDPFLPSFQPVWIQLLHQ